MKYLLKYIKFCRIYNSIIETICKEEKQEVITNNFSDFATGMEKHTASLYIIDNLCLAFFGLLKYDIANSEEKVSIFSFGGYHL